jgi:predicted Zn-dependent protease
MANLLRVMGCFALIGPLQAIEPKVTRASYNLFSDQEEVVLGKQFAAETAKKIVVLRDAVLVDYLEGIVKKLGAKTQRPLLTYHVLIVDSPQINAYSQPGGYIYVYRGLLNMAWNEGELAGMLAHEISHVVARHNMNRLSRHTVALELSKRAKMQGAKLLLTASELTAWEGAFSRSEELDADMLGFYTMLRAGWNPSCLITALDGLRAFTGETDLVADMLATHPPTAERSRNLTEELKIVDPPATLRRDSPAFQLMKDLLRELPPPRGK